MPDIVRDGRGYLLPVTLAALLTTAIVAALYLGRGVFVPLALAVLLSFVLSPVVRWLRRLLLPRVVAVAAVVLFTVALTAALGLVIASQVADLGNELPRYESTLRTKLKVLRTGMAQTTIVDRATATLNELSKELEPRKTVERPPAETTDARPIPVEVHQPPERPVDTLLRIVAALIQPLTTTGIVMLLVVFILLQREDIRDRVIRLAGAGDLETTTTALNDAAFRLSRLFLVQSVLNAGYGAVIALGLWLIGVPSPILWGVVAGLLRFVPYIGAILAAIFPVLLSAAVDPGWTMTIWTLALFLTVEPAVGHFLEPWMQGQTTGLSPLAIVISAIFWTALWGPIGLLLATPVTICLVVLGRHVEGLAFLDVLLGDQPALSPPEIFYQRILAGSTAEALEQAEDVIGSSSTTSYLDSVVVPGLQFANLDRQRGLIDDARLLEVQEGTRDLLSDVAEMSRAAKAKGKDAEPVPSERRLAPGWEHGAILCLGARTPLDSAAAEVLALAIRRHGVPVRSAALSHLRDIARLDLDGIKLVWLSAIDATHSNAQIRFAARRLRVKSPDIMVCGAFWDGYGGGATRDAHGLEHVVATVAAATDLTLDLATVVDPEADAKGDVVEAAGAEKSAA